jgi:hypothetical protein
MSTKRRTSVGARVSSVGIEARGVAVAAPRRGAGRAVTSNAAVDAVGLSGHGGPDVMAIRRGYGMSRVAFARLTGFSERALANWESHKQAPDVPTTRRLRELERLRKALCTIITPEGLATWLDGPNQAFGGLKPLEVIERGETDRLWRMIFELDAGAMT